VTVDVRPGQGDAPSFVTSRLLEEHGLPHLFTTRHFPGVVRPTEPRPPFGPEQNTANAERIARLRAFGREELRQQKFHPRFAKRFPPDIRETLTDDADRIDLEGMIKLLELTLPVLTVRPVFADTAVPTLLVNGRWERGFQPLRDWAAEALPRLRVVDLEGGHSINIEQPEAFNRAVVDFLLPLA
jgi:pimeloyl-ACP methyl ester carboxylesterase